jgi:hypothetical protein
LLRPIGFDPVVRPLSGARAPEPAAFQYSQRACRSESAPRLAEILDTHYLMDERPDFRSSRFMHGMISIDAFSPMNSGSPNSRYIRGCFQIKYCDHRPLTVHGREIRGLGLHGFKRLANDIR